MNPAEMIVSIVAIVVIGGVLRARAMAHGRGEPTIARHDDDDTHRLAREVRHLKERIQVLERVITDNRSSADLTQEIERLRDR